MQHYPAHLQSLIAAFKKLPGVGSKSAERFAFDLIEWPPHDLEMLAELIRATPEKIAFCDECGCIRKDQGCPFCTDARKASGTLSVIASPKDAFAIESTHSFQGIYHVLQGMISPLDGIGPDEIGLDKLAARLATLKVREVILALDSTVEGDATSLYLKQELASLPLSISRLAFGLPMGSPIDYVDGGTLARALLGRSRY